MKKIILFSLTFIFIGSVSANNYPEDINNGEKLISVENFRGIYQKIHQDVNNEDLVEVCYRTLQWPNFWKKNKDGKSEQFYSIENCRNLSEKNELTESFLSLNNKNFTQFEKMKNDFKVKFEIERSLLRLENNLQRQAGLAYIFADGAEDINNSPFDLVSDLNEIDEIFFGEMHDRPDFKFIATSDQVISHTIPEEGSDIWLEQLAKNLAEKKDKFKNPLESFAGSLWSLGIKNFREKLNSNDLSLAHVPKTAFDSSVTDGYSSQTGATADTHSVPPQSNDQPDAIKLKYNPLPTLNAYITTYVLEQSTYATDAAEYAADRSTHIGRIMSIDEAKTELITKDLRTFEKDNSRESAQTNFREKSAILTRFNQIIDLFKEKMKILRKDIIPNFLKKPQHSS